MNILSIKNAIKHTAVCIFLHPIKTCIIVPNTVFTYTYSHPSFFRSNSKSHAGTTPSQHIKNTLVKSPKRITSPFSLQADPKKVKKKSTGNRRTGDYFYGVSLPARKLSLFTLSAKNGTVG